MKALVLAMAVGGLVGLQLGERDGVEPDPWLGEALRALVGDARPADVDRALFAVERHLLDAPDDVAAITLKHRLEHQQSCRTAFEQGEHAMANGDRGEAIEAFRGVDSRCGLHGLARTRLNQLDAPTDGRLGISD